MTIKVKLLNQAIDVITNYLWNGPMNITLSRYPSKYSSNLSKISKFVKIRMVLQNQIIPLNRWLRLLVIGSYNAKIMIKKLYLNGKVNNKWENMLLTRILNYKKFETHVKITKKWAWL